MEAKEQQDLSGEPDVGQVALLGAEGVRRLRKTRVLICGLRGVGVEVAKVLALEGVGTITLHDNTRPRGGHSPRPLYR